MDITKAPLFLIIPQLYTMKTLSGFEVPTSMRALILPAFESPMEIQQVPVASPGKGEVLVKIDSAPVNPSDWSFIRGMYSSKKNPPVIPGFEGSGTIVATGNDFMSRRLLGKEVACFAPQDGNGTWAEFMVTNNKTVIPLGKGFDLEQGSMLLVNPLTVFAMVEITKKRKIKAIANTAAASALGQMLERLCQEKGIDLVNIVRRQEQVALLKSKGTRYVLNSSDPNFTKDMKQLFRQLDVKLAFDAISDDSPFSLLEALPRHGEVMLYGALSEKAVIAHPGRFIFEDKCITGFWLSSWIAKQNIFKLLGLFKKVRKFITERHQTTIAQRLPLEEAQKGIQKYLEKMSEGKVIIKPGMKD